MESHSTMESPFSKLRKRRHWTKRQLAEELGSRTRAISDVEDGKKRISDKFYRSLWKIGEDAFNIAVEQNVFIKKLQEFRRCLVRGERPPSIG